VPLELISTIQGKFDPIKCLKGMKIDFCHLTMIEIDVSYPKVIELLDFGHSWVTKRNFIHT